MFEAVEASFEGVSAVEATAVLLVLSLGGAVLFETVLVRTALRLVSRTETTYDNILLASLRVPLIVSIALAGIFVLTTSVPAVVESTVFTPEQLRNFFERPSVAVVVLVWAWGLNQLVNRVVEELKTRGTRFDFAPIISNVWTIAVVVGAAAALLRLYDIDITPLLGAAGIAGVAIGFAAKDTVANFFGGIALYFDDTYKLGDYVVLDSGEAGTVVKVGIRSTTLLTRDEVLITVPNSVLNAAKIVNESAPQRRKRIRVPIGVAYGTDIDAFEELMTDLAVAEPMVLDSPKPRMRFRRFGDSALEYELLCWVNSPTRSARTIHALNRGIYRALNDADIEIPYPRRDVTVRGEASRPEPLDGAGAIRTETDSPAGSVEGDADLATGVGDAGGATGATDGGSVDDGAGPRNHGGDRSHGR